MDAALAAVVPLELEVLDGVGHVHAPAVHRRLLERGVLAGLPLAGWYPDDPILRDALLVCATEVTSDADIERFATAIAADVGT